VSDSRHDLKAIDGWLGRRVSAEERHDRATCEHAGRICHYGCGVCEHGLVYFECQPCLTDRIMRSEGVEPHSMR
jgi:hypothetical protein